MKHGHFIRFIPTLLFILLLAVCFLSMANVKILREKDVVKGEITLDDRRLEASVYALDGTWEFYPYALSPAECVSPYFITVPQSWRKNAEHFDFVDGQGFGTYHVRIQLPSAGLYGIYTSFISSAYELSINDTKLICNGSVGTSPDCEISSWNKQILFFQADSDVVDLYLTVSNYHYKYGGINRCLYIGYPEVINRLQVLTVINNALYLGILITISFYIIIFNRSLHRKKASLYLGLFGLSTMLFQAIMDGSILMYLFPHLPIPFVSRLTYLAYITNVLAYLGYIYHTFPCHRCKKLYHYFFIIDEVFLIITAFTPLCQWIYYEYIFFLSVVLHILFVFYLLWRALKQKQRYVKLTLVSIVDMVICTGIEILNFHHILSSPFITNNFYIFGQLIFLLFQSYVVATDMEEAFLNAQQANNMELAFLQAQISPHFFFNVLNNIYYLLDTNPPMAKNLLIQFNAYLRVKHKFDFRNCIFYSLKEELDLVQAFVNIERVRLNNQVQLICNISNDLLSLSVPPLILQPLVENSIKHGFNSVLLTIRILVTKEKDYALFSIQNDGKGMGFDLIQRLKLSSQQGTGVGIKNINYRLNKCYHEQLSIESNLGEGTTISFHIPLEVNYEHSNY